MLLHEASNSLRVVRFVKYSKGQTMVESKVSEITCSPLPHIPYLFCGRVDKKTGRKNLDVYLLFVYGFHDWDSVTSSLIKLFQTQSKYLLIILTLETYIPKLKLHHHFNFIRFGLSLELSSLTLTS